jgi:dipeptidyl-peptidase-3
MALLGTLGCGGGQTSSGTTSPPPAGTAPAAVSTGLGQAPTDRKYLLEQVDEAAVVQVYADGFSALSLKEKMLVWHLSQAALVGRDIYYDQRYAHNLEMRDVIEAMVTHPGDADAGTRAEIQRYAKLFWINTGPYNNLTARKFVLKCTPEAFTAAARAAEKAGAQFPLRNGESVGDLLTRLKPLFFDASVDAMVTSKTPPPGEDILASSANNFYIGLTMKDLEGYREEHPLNSRLVKRDGRIVEEVYRVGGLYGRQISAIVAHLEAAIPFATDATAGALRALITLYQTGAIKDREAYDIAWVQDKSSPVDTINGFTEVYLDARGIKGAW